MNSIIAPTIATLYKRTNLFIKYNSRTIQEARNKTELRILVCIHSYCNVPGILKLLEISHGSGHNQMTVFALHFVDLPDQPSSVLIVHDSHSPRFEETKANGGHHDYDSSETDQIVTAFNEFEKTNDNVRVQSLTTLSPITAMHGDICSLAEDKFVALLILPFHKHATKEQCLEEIISSFPNINQDVLDNAPCSVGIFIDRGFEVTNGSDPDYGVHEIAMVFIGGADDCEALSYAWRMARKPGVLLTVIRLLETDSRDQRKSNELDDDCINDFRIQTSNDEFIVYEEKILNDGEELIEALKEMENKFELFIVGRRDGVDSPITSELLDRIDYLELGIIGDLLAASDSATSSILVVKQFVNLIDNKVIEDLIGTQWLSMDRSAMNFGSRRLLMATSNTLWMYSEQKLKEMHGVDEGDVDDGDGDGNGVNP
ncbi:cation/H(+) antiporter 15-like [Gossypium hirsutum]|uniref:Cation/H(+) antiporter 15-like n=2 Tax=Gossypium TaxID=3633 RepID=A0ABM3BWK1_GOSHI|nr:cation/H(+) antiporter 15-like [Gossypium hirsutum]